MICPVCGIDAKDKKICPNCEYSLEVYDKARKISITLYNKGLYLIKDQCITQGLNVLSKSIQIDKNNISARNLMGLTEFYLGNVGEALKQWIISLHIKKDNNIASEYIDNAQKNKSKLSKYNEAIVMYNEAIKYMRDNNDDMAIIRLKKAVFLNTNFLKAYSLLAMIYIKQDNQEKAMYYIDRAMKIDINNETILKYYKILYPNATLVNNKNPKQKVGVKQKPKQVVNKKKLKVGLTFLVGTIIIISTLLFYVLRTCMFGKLTEIKNENVMLQQKNEEYQKSIEEYKADILRLEEEMRGFSKDKKIYDYMNFIDQATELYEKNKLEDAAIKLKDIDVKILDKETQENFNNIASKVFPEISYEYYTKGKKFYDSKKYDTALIDFEKANYFSNEEKHSDDVTYYIGTIYEQKGEIEKAIEYYDEVINNYKDSTAYSKATLRKNKITG